MHDEQRTGEEYTLEEELLQEMLQFQHNIFKEIKKAASLIKEAEFD